MTKNLAIGQRIAAVLEALELNQSEFYARTKINQSQMSKVINGNKQFSHGMIEKMLSVYPYINITSIFTGIGPLFFTDQYDQVKESQAPYKTDDPLFRARHHLLAALGEVDAAIAKNCQ